MTAADQRIARQRGETIERGEHLFRRAFEYPPAADAEQRVAAEHDAVAVIRDMRTRVPGNPEHIELQRRIIELDAIAVCDTMRCESDPIVIRSIDRNLTALDQRFGAADVVRMMVREQHRGEIEPLARQCRANRCGFSGIDDDRPAGRIGEQPDVIVRKRRHSDDAQVVAHGRRDYSQPPGERR